MPHSIAPLSGTQFTQFILVPYVACKLIQEDLSCDIESAYKAMVDSADVGVSLYPADEEDEDEELARIVRSNFRAARHDGMMDYDSDNQGIIYEIVENNMATSTTQPGSSAVSRPKPRQRRIARAAPVAMVSRYVLTDSQS